MIYANESYQYADFFYRNIPINYRLNWMEKITECSLFNDDEIVAIKLIETTPDKDLEKMFTFMKDNDIYSKLCSLIDNLGGDNNYEALTTTVFEKWKKCYGNKSFNLLEQKHFFFNKGVIYFSLAKGGVVGTGGVGAKAKTSCGFGVDSYNNYIFFTGTAYYAFAGNYSAGNISNLNSLINGFSYSIADISIMFDWLMNDVRGLIGQQDAGSISGAGDIVESVLDLKGGAGVLIPSPSFDVDANDHSFQGAGLSFGLGVGVAIDKSQSVNTGIIVTAGELGSLLNSFVKLPNYEPLLNGIPSPYFPNVKSFVGEDNTLKFRCSFSLGDDIIETGIPAKEEQTKDGTSYIISLNAEANYYKKPTEK